MFTTMQRGARKFRTHTLFIIALGRVHLIDEMANTSMDQSCARGVTIVLLSCLWYEKQCMSLIYDFTP